jgi:hypothetical protein
MELNKALMVMDTINMGDRSGQSAAASTAAHCHLLETRNE